MSWVKKEVNYIRDSFSQIISGIIVFVLASSGLGIAIILRFLGFNGTIISFVGIIVEIFALLLVYLYLRKYIELKAEEQEKPKGKLK
jgi:hypothetical protein